MIMHFVYSQHISKWKQFYFRNQRSNYFTPAVITRGCLKKNLILMVDSFMLGNAKTPLYYLFNRPIPFTHCFSNSSMVWAREHKCEILRIQDGSPIASNRPCLWSARSVISNPALNRFIALQFMPAASIFSSLITKSLDRKKCVDFIVAYPYSKAPCTVGINSWKS